MKPADYLKRPYARAITPDSDGTYRGEIFEFPGCIATGDTAAEAMSNLERVAESWIELVLSKGRRVPDPIDVADFSGKLVVRLPRSLHGRAAAYASREGVSLNQFILASIAEHVGASSNLQASRVKKAIFA